MSIINALFDPTYRLLVGVSEPEVDGGIRVYLNARHTGLHTHCSEPSEIANVTRAWQGSMDHQYIRIPDEALCDCPEPVANA